MNTMETIKLFPVNIFIPVTKFPRLTILFFLQKEAISDLWLVQVFFQRNQRQNLGICIEKERERKNMNG